MVGPSRWTSMPVARSTRDKVAFQRTSESAHNQEDPESDEKTADEEMTSLVRSPVFLATNRRQQDTQDQEEPTWNQCMMKFIANELCNFFKLSEFVNVNL